LYIDLSPTKLEEAGSYKIKITAEDQIGKDEQGAFNLYSSASITVIVEAPPVVEVFEKVIIF